MKSTSMVKPVKLGNNERKTFSKIKEVIDMPNLIEIQKDSYKWFVDEGLREVFRDMSAITDYSGNLQLSFVDYRLEDTPKYDVTECKARDTTYAAPLRVTARLLNDETGEIKESEVFMGDFPLMTESGTFVINGAERAIVSQLVRSPGVYFDDKKIDEKTGKVLFASTIIPNRGAWLEYETSPNDTLFVRIDKNRKLPKKSDGLAHHLSFFIHSNTDIVIIGRFVFGCFLPAAEYFLSLGPSFSSHFTAFRRDISAAGLFVKSGSRCHIYFTPKDWLNTCIFCGAIKINHTIHNTMVSNRETIHI